MKLVYTAIFEDVGSYIPNSFFCNKFFDRACLLLSVTLSKQYFNNIEIRTTPDMGEFLSELFSDVSIVHQNCQQFGDYNWQMNKIMSYSQQSEPFLHIDHDVFISKNPNLELWNSGFLTQNLESSSDKQDHIRSVYFMAKNNGHIFPEYAEERATQKLWTQHNMGLFGCFDLEKCHQYCQDIFGCAGNGRPFSGQAIIYEQFCFTAFANKNEIPVMTFLDNNSIEDDAERKGYCHLMGGKSRVDTMSRTIDSLGRHNPEALYKLYKTFDTKTGDLKVSA